MTGTLSVWSTVLYWFDNFASNATVMWVLCFEAVEINQSSIKPFQLIG